jgi:hypothetical protein
MQIEKSRWVGDLLTGRRSSGALLGDGGERSGRLDSFKLRDFMAAMGSVWTEEEMSSV